MFWTPRLLYLFRYGKQELPYPLEDETFMGQVKDVAILKGDGHLLFILFQGLNVLQGEFVFVSHIFSIKETYLQCPYLSSLFCYCGIYLLSNLGWYNQIGLNHLKH